MASDSDSASTMATRGEVLHSSFLLGRLFGNNDHRRVQKQLLPSFNRHCVQPPRRVGKVARHESSLETHNLHHLNDVSQSSAVRGGHLDTTCHDPHESKATPAPLNPLGTLGNLISEIREMIYTLVIVAGSTSLTRTSKGLNIDTKQVLIRSGIYRVRVELREIKHGGSSLYAYRPWRNRLYPIKAHNLGLRVLCPKGVRIF